MSLRQLGITLLEGGIAELRERRRRLAVLRNELNRQIDELNKEETRALRTLLMLEASPEDS